MVHTPVNRSVHSETTVCMESRSKILLSLCTAMTRNLLPNAWAAPARQLWHAIARRVWPHDKCPVLAIKHDIEKLVAASRDGRNEGNSLEGILLLAEVIDFVYNSKGEHGLRVEDPARVRALVGMIRKMKDILETPREEVGKEFGDYSAWGADNDSGETCSIASSDPSEAGSVAGFSVARK